MTTGGFSYVYLVKEIADTSGGQSLNSTVHGGEAAVRRGSASGVVSKGERRSTGNNQSGEKKDMVLKVTSILSRQQRDIAEKEAKLLSRLSHPSIIKMFDTCYRTVSHTGSNKKDPKKERPQHLILMEYCDGGHALDVCNSMVKSGTRFDLSTLIIAFGQICNAVSYLHAQRPPIVHRDLKPANFLVKNGAYKLCDFGSAVFGHVDLKTPETRREAEEVIEKTTTPMFRAPEMVDLYMAKKLTQATDVWALGCCLFSLAFLQNCFEEGSNLAILSGKYKIPEDNPYGEGLVELIDRMLTLDCKARADMTEVILCLSAVYSGRPLPARKDRSKRKEEESSRDRKDRGGDKERASSSSSRKKKEEKSDATGTFRTNSQGVYEDDLALDPEIVKKAPKERRKVDPNSALARRLAAAGKVDSTATSARGEEDKGDEFVAFPPSSTDFGADFGSNTFDSFDGKASKTDAFGAFNPETDKEILSAFGGTGTGTAEWVNSSGVNGNGRFDAFASFLPEDGGVTTTLGNVDAKDDSATGKDKDDEANLRNNRKASKTKSSFHNDVIDSCESGDSDRGKRGQLHPTQSGSRRQGRSNDNREDLAAVEDAHGDGVDDGKDRDKHGVRRPRSNKKEGSRRTSSNPEDIKEIADKVRKDSRHSSSRHSGSSSRKPTKSKDEETTGL